MFIGDLMQKMMQIKMQMRNNLTASVYGTQSLDTADISSFIAFDSVDAATVQGWIETVMGEDEVQTLKDNLDANITEQINPASVTKNLVG